MIGQKNSENHKGHKEHKEIKGCGRDAGGERKGIYKNREKTASWTGMRLESGFLETTWTTRDNFFKVCRPTCSLNP